MITDPTIRPAVAELERAYDTLAKLAFNRQMHPRPVIIIQSRGRRQTALAWYATSMWGPRGAHTAPEITICAETLYQPTAEIIITLVHEMVHHACAVGGVRDTTTKGYHNQPFRDAAEAAGLVVERDGPRGWARTNAGRTYRGTGDPGVCLRHLSRLAGVTRPEAEHPYAALVVWLHDHPRRDRGARDMYTLRTGVYPTMTQVPYATRRPRLHRRARHPKPAQWRQTP